MSSRTKEDVLEKMFDIMPYAMQHKPQILPYIKEAMDIYATSQWNAAIEAAKDDLFHKMAIGDIAVSGASQQQILIELQKLKK